MLDIQKTDELYSFQELIVNSFYKLREATQPTLSEAELANFGKYGSGLVFDNFKPHITLGKVKTTVNLESIALIGKSIALTEVDQNGCVRKVLSYIPQSCR